MFSTVLIGLALVFMAANLVHFFAGHRYERSYFQSSLFQKLFFAMTGITIGFAVLYYALGLDAPVLRLNDEDGRESEGSFWEYLYFSGVTMLSVGYGDLVPVGPARFFAILQAGIGLLLPTAFFVHVLHERPGNAASDRGRGEKEGQGNYSDKRDKDDWDDEETERADRK
ncbi:potassium channel family protein [Planococcus sp. FY231025]|uniref:potassium channel family protein n=1 Tax=Planococcus sp. FY231025 TaxID=3455699 RepID=UPI003F8DAE8F